MKTRYAKRRKKLKIMVFIVLVSIGILFALFVKKSKSEHEGINMAQACKVIAYACGYQPSDGHGNYWYDEYIDYVREKQIFTDFKAKDAFTRKYAKELFSYCGVNFTEELYSYDTFSNEQFSQLIYELKDFFSSGDNLSWMEAAVVATPDMDSQLSGWSVCTDKGIYSFKGLKLSGKVDKNCVFLTCGSEILMFVKETGTEVIYKNVWIYKIENNKMYIDLYGIKRKFQVGNIENIGSALADVSLENKKIDAINLKKDTISGKVLSVSDEYIEITGYGKVFVDETNKFKKAIFKDLFTDIKIKDIKADGDKTTVKVTGKQKDYSQVSFDQSELNTTAQQYVEEHQDELAKVYKEEGLSAYQIKVYDGIAPILYQSMTETYKSAPTEKLTATFTLEKKNDKWIITGIDE